MDTQLTPDARTQLIDAVAAHVPPARGQDCVRVAVDGVDGAGKTWFANDLADTLRGEGRPVVRVSTDDWHHQRSRRYAHGRTSPLGFWLDSYDHHRMRHEVLDPLGPGGTRWFRRRGHDLRTDAILHDPLEAAPAGAVIVVDGLFLQRAEFHDCFELVSWLQVPFEITAQRMAHRDGTPPDPTHPAMRRYIQGQQIYLEERAPQTTAHLLIDNSDPAAPRMLAPSDRQA